MIDNQGYLFLIFALNGIIIGLLFDFFRVLRRAFNTKDLITYIEDIIFWCLTGALILYSTFTFNNGEIRLFMFIGIFLGVIIYMITFSSYIIKINVKIILTIKAIIKKIFGILITPFIYIIKIFKKIFFKPINIFLINFKNFSTKKLIKSRNIVKK